MRAIGAIRDFSNCMIRTPDQNKKLHAMFSDFARGFSFEGVRLTAAEWKIILVVYHRLALAEAEGFPIPEAGAPESTSLMDVDRMNSLIEYCYFIGAQIGVNFPE